MSKINVYRWNNCKTKGQQIQWMYRTDGCTKMVFMYESKFIALNPYRITINAIKYQNYFFYDLKVVLCLLWRSSVLIFSLPVPLQSTLIECMYAHTHREKNPSICRWCTLKSWTKCLCFTLVCLFTWFFIKKGGRSGWLFVRRENWKSIPFTQLKPNEVRRLCCGCEKKISNTIEINVKKTKQIW